MSVFTDRYDAIKDAVVTLTNRPDYVDEIALAIRNATLSVHLCDHFPRDVVSTSVPASTSSFSQQLDTLALFARFRDVSAIALRNADGEQILTPPIELVEIGDLYEPGYPGVRKQNIAWLAGSIINIYSSLASYGCYVDWFQSPSLDRDSYNSWIADSFPDPIVWYASMIVWNRSGNEKKSSEARTMLFGTPGNDYTALIPTLKRNFSTTAGR